jgi:hypothetical protein
MDDWMAWIWVNPGTLVDVGIPFQGALVRATRQVEHPPHSQFRWVFTHQHLEDLAQAVTFEVAQIPWELEYLRPCLCNWGTNPFRK